MDTARADQAKNVFPQQPRPWYDAESRARRPGQDVCPQQPRPRYDVESRAEPSLSACAPSTLHPDTATELAQSCLDSLT